MAQAVSRLTYSDYQLLPDDGTRYEIIAGELYMTPAPVTRHQLIVGRLTQALMNYLDIHPIGTVLAAPTDVLLSETDVVQPDLLFVHNDSQARITEKNIQGPPNVVVEILSPGTSARDRQLKRNRYEHFGVAEYWLVDPNRDEIELLRLASGHYHSEPVLTRPMTLTSPLFPELSVSLDGLFR